MNEEAQLNLQKIRKVSGLVVGACTFLMIGATVLFLINVGQLFLAGNRAVMLAAPSMQVGDTEISAAQMPGKARILMALVLAVYAALCLKGLGHLRKLFKNYHRGQVFSKDSVRQMRRLTDVALLFCLFEILVQQPIGYLMAYLSGIPIDRWEFLIPGEMLILAGIFALISWVMDAGRVLHEENELTV